MNDATANAKAAAASARRQLADTLELIEEKFDVTQRANDLVEDVTQRTSEFVDRAKTSYEKNPVPWIVGGAAVAILAVGLVAWAIFGGDDD